VVFLGIQLRTLAAERELRLDLGIEQTSPVQTRGFIILNLVRTLVSLWSHFALLSVPSWVVKLMNLEVGWRQTHLGQSVCIDMGESSLYNLGADVDEGARFELIVPLSLNFVLSLLLLLLFKLVSP
jgi:hypothetical protein